MYRVTLVNPPFGAVSSAVGASVVPARRAGRIDPALTLRAE